MDTLRPITIEVTASELPESIVSRFSERPAADTRLIVTVESAETDEEKFWALKSDIEIGLADSAAGRFSSGEEVLARLEKQFPPA